MNLVIDSYHYKIKYTDADDSGDNSYSDRMFGTSWEVICGRFFTFQIRGAADSLGIKDDLCNYSKSQEPRRS